MLKTQARTILNKVLRFVAAWIIRNKTSGSAPGTAGGRHATGFDE